MIICHFSYNLQYSAMERISWISIRYQQASAAEFGSLIRIQSRPRFFLPKNRKRKILYIFVKASNVNSTKTKKNICFFTQFRSDPDPDALPRLNPDPVRIGFHDTSTTCIILEQYQGPYGWLKNVIHSTHIRFTVISKKSETKYFEPLFQPRRTERLARKGCFGGLSQLRLVMIREINR